MIFTIGLPELWYRREGPNGGPAPLGDGGTFCDYCGSDNRARLDWRVAADQCRADDADGWISALGWVSHFLIDPAEDRFEIVGGSSDFAPVPGNQDTPETAFGHGRAPEEIGDVAGANWKAVQRFAGDKHDTGVEKRRLRRPRVSPVF